MRWAGSGATRTSRTPPPPRPTTRFTRTPAGCTTASPTARRCTTCAGCGRGSSCMDDIRAELADLHQHLPRNGLVAWTAGNLSARVPGEELMAIKASGIAYEELDER